MMSPADSQSGTIRSTADAAMCVALDMTFPNRLRVRGVTAYARSLRDALRNLADVEVREISGPLVSDPGQTLLWLLSGARRELLGGPASVLHCPAFVTPWRSPVPVVINIHDAGTQRFPDDYPLEWRVYNRFILPLVARGAARIIALSEFSRREAIKYYRVHKRQVVVVPAAPGAEYKPQPPKTTRKLLDDLGLLSDNGSRNPLLLFSGAPFRRKNLDIILRAMSGASEGSRVSEAMLLISGADENEFSEYQAWIASHGLQGRVRWLGKVPHELMPVLYSAVDLLAYPSIYEGFGLPPLEAMSVGTPVVAARASCLPEVLGDAALLVPPDDDRGFARAMEALLTEQELRERMVQAGKARAASYTWERSARQTVEVYHAAVKGNRRRS